MQPNLEGTPVVGVRPGMRELLGYRTPDNS